MSRNDQFGDQHARIEGMFDQLNQDLNERRRLLRGGANTTKINMEVQPPSSSFPFPLPLNPSSFFLLPPFPSSSPSSPRGFLAFFSPSEFRTRSSRSPLSP
eukprot:TRINITY_DN839_c0_g2_i1.p2 TRINITY_DN839_c0_g2~~TRINITY_DN839_c0_g2_i1.p2  ORF type:complete len:101 (+),score=22.51 TRINITY_DN839_c0_g2_i1:100-402(+)